MKRAKGQPTAINAGRETIGNGRKPGATRRKEEAIVRRATPGEGRARSRKRGERPGDGANHLIEVDAAAKSTGMRNRAACSWISSIAEAPRVGDWNPGKETGRPAILTKDERIEA